MNYKINLGEWSSVFAVPSSLVTKHIKLAGETQLKVILYLLCNSDKSLSSSDISQALSISESEIKNAVEFWIDRGLITGNADALTPSGDKKTEEEETEVQPHQESQPEVKKHTVSRAQRPDSYYVGNLLRQDPNLAMLMTEAQEAFSKPLSSGDTATLVMLYDSFGLPCDVIAMLIHYCASINRPNIRSVEKIGIEWSDKGIYSIELAEKEINHMENMSGAWSRVSSLFGIRNVGSPTRSQLEHADRWLNTWGFSDEMLYEAYERCVNTKGEYNIKYINAILKKWYEKGIKSLDALKEAESSAKKSVRKKPAKSSVFSSDNASYDLAQYEEKSIFDD